MVELAWYAPGTNRRVSDDLDDILLAELARRGPSVRGVVDCIASCYDLRPDGYECTRRRKRVYLIIDA